MINKISTGAAGPISISLVGRFGGVVESEVRMNLAVNFKSIIQKRMKMMSLGKRLKRK